MSHEQPRDNAGSPETGYLVASDTEPESVKDRGHQEDDISSIPISRLVIDSRQQDEHNNTTTPTPRPSAPTDAPDPDNVPVTSSSAIKALVESQAKSRTHDGKKSHLELLPDSMLTSSQELRMMMEILLRSCKDEVAYLEDLLNLPETFPGDHRIFEFLRGGAHVRAQAYVRYLRKMEEAQQG